MGSGGARGAPASNEAPGLCGTSKLAQHVSPGRSDKHTL